MPSPVAPRRTPPVVHVIKGGFKLAVLLVAVSLVGMLFMRSLESNDRHGLRALERNEGLVGAWLGDWPTASNNLIEDFEARTAVRLDIVDVFLDWYTPVANVSHSLREIASHGALAVLTWEPHGFSTQEIVDGTKSSRLRDGRHVPLGEYLDEFAHGVCEVVRDTHQPVILRIMHEMNGHWFWWGISHTDETGNRVNTADSYRRAWVKIHDAFESKCPPNGARFIFAINHFSVGDGVTFMGAYPGDAYVDLMGIDGYNWGGKAGWGWQDFDTLYAEAYCAVTAVTDKPIIVAEVASTEEGGDKAAWIRDAYEKMSSSAYNRIQGIVYFNHAKYEIEIQNTMDWPIDSSPEALAAFQDGVKMFKAYPPHSRVLTEGGPPC